MSSASVGYKNSFEWKMFTFLLNSVMFTGTVATCFYALGGVTHAFSGQFLAVLYLATCICLIHHRVHVAKMKEKYGGH